MRLLGHSETGVTMNICGHVLPTELVHPVDAMKNVLWDDGQQLWLLLMSETTKGVRHV
ncbi:hypothetical protein [Micromonospora sp. U21]|uniref:hypothetical protein n=1 Tax=Micromonospora sp. U21 TaxID=2824899 RepID=UPI001B3758AE|nr:hypothetical protein [Micromonospora sp. U21]MBQ0903082.1 hypothetical protein [Micromonospora sp. U21]